MGAGPVLRFLFADTGAFLWVLRTFLKVAVAYVIAYCSYDYVANREAVLGKDESTSIEVIGKFVNDQVRAVASSQQSDDVTKASPSYTFRFLLEDRGSPALGYEFRADGESKGNGADARRSACEDRNGRPRMLFTTVSFLSCVPIPWTQIKFTTGITAAHIGASTDVLLRDFESLLLQLRDGAGDLQLCVGTRDVLPRKSCDVTQKIDNCFNMGLCGGKDGKPLTPTLSDILAGRTWAAFVFGEIQLLCLVVMFYALIQCIGLYATYVLPGPKLFEIRKSKLMPLEGAAAQPRIVQPIGDWLYESARRAGSNADRDLISMRDHVETDALARVGNANRLADIVLKLAFLGTIIGIGHSLYAARGLDTAYPIDRLLVKSEMYAGIGVAFGGTFIGILCSIAINFAAQWTENAWVEAIDRNFLLVRDYILPPLTTAATEPDTGKLDAKRGRTALTNISSWFNRIVGSLHDMGAWINGGSLKPESPDPTDAVLTQVSKWVFVGFLAILLLLLVAVAYLLI